MSKREIKFRAWDKESKKFLKGRHFSDIGDDFLGIAFDGQVLRHTNNGFSIGNSLEINQYTGLKDKNGVEIYQDDILEKDNIKYKVGFENGRYNLTDFDGSPYDNGDYYRGDEIYWEEFIVMGNIWEQ